MKKIFMAMMAIATLSMVMVGCKKEPQQEEPQIKKTVPEVAATEGAVTIVWNAVNYSECNGLVFAGSYNDYGTDPASMVKFEKIEGYTNWYKAVVTPKDPAAEPVLDGKPCALAEDGTFPSSWNYQWIGSEEHPCELISGEAEFAVEYQTETKLIVKKNSSVVFVRSYGFKEDPCVKAQTYTVNFTLNVEAAVPEGATVAVVGDFPVGWNVTNGEAYAMKRESEHQFTIEIDGIALGKEYKYVVLNDNNDWANEMYPTAPVVGDTCVAKIAGNMTISDVTVIDNIAGFVGITTDLPFCEAEPVVPPTPASFETGQELKVVVALEDASILANPDVLYVYSWGTGDEQKDFKQMTKEADGTFTYTFIVDNGETWGDSGMLFVDADNWDSKSGQTADIKPVNAGNYTIAADWSVSAK